MKTTKTFIEKKIEEFDLTFYLPRRATNPLTIGLEEALIERNSLTKIFIFKALTDQAQEILEMEELKEENKLPDQYMRVNREKALRNDVRSQIKTAIRERYLK